MGLLENATSGSDQEIIPLHDDSPVAFTYFHYYVYHKDVKFPVVTNHHELENYVRELCETWVFGDKYDIPGLQNCVSYELCKVLSNNHDHLRNIRFHESDESFLAKDCFKIHTMRYCYEHTTSGAALRNLVVDHLAFLTLRLEPEPPFTQPLVAFVLAYE